MMSLADNAVYTFNTNGAPNKKIEDGHCLADITCGDSCETCPGCECLMTDGRVVSCEYGACLCTENCLCSKDDDCSEVWQHCHVNLLARPEKRSQVCSMDYSPSLCGGQVCRVGTLRALRSSLCLCAPGKQHICACCASSC